MTKNSAVQFFVKHAGFSYDPKKETAAQGRLRGAKRLAAAEREAKRKGFFYRWSVDPHADSSDFSDEKPAWELWQAAMYNADREIVASLHGIDFGRNGSPNGAPYKRVVEAELAIEGLTNPPQGKLRENPRGRESRLSIPEQHQKKIAYKTLRMTPLMARVMGGMDFEEAYRIIFRRDLRERLNELVTEYGRSPRSLSWELQAYGWETPGELLTALDLISGPVRENPAKPRNAFHERGLPDWTAPISREDAEFHRTPADAVPRNAFQRRDLERAQPNLTPGASDSGTIRLRKNPDEGLYSIAAFKARQRVQLHPATDVWMCGDKYGTVVRVTGSMIHVKMDRSGKTYRVAPRNISEIL